MLRLGVYACVAAGTLGFTVARTEAAPALVSCFTPNNHIAGLRTPNPRHLPIVAHKYLPFGTVVRFSKGQTFVDAIVKDRGPYKGKREYDLECQVLARLGVDGVGEVNAEVQK